MPRCRCAAYLDQERGNERICWRHALSRLTIREQICCKLRETLTDNRERDYASWLHLEISRSFLDHLLKSCGIICIAHQDSIGTGRQGEISFAPPLAFVEPTDPSLLLHLKANNAPALVL